MHLMRSNKIKKLRLSYYRLLGPSGRAKVFGVGLSRTGTRSLHTALKRLGYRSDHFSTHLVEVEGSKISLDWHNVALYDALTDIIASLFFRDLDRFFPGSKFILTHRASDSWVRSCERHFLPLRTDGSQRRLMALRTAMYGQAEFDAERFRAVYDHHNNAVRQYFGRRQGDLLELDLCANPSWERLCSFLDCPRPRTTFPWKNRTDHPFRMNA